MLRSLSLAVALALVGAGASFADTLRIATYNAELSRRGPGLLLADILKGDEQVAAVVAVIAGADPDVLLITDFDIDTEGHALAAFADLFGGGGYPFRFAATPNAGVETGRDMDGNGRPGEARDSQGYGSFTGQGGMVVLSRLPLGAVRDFSGFLWSDLPGAIAPEVDGHPFPSAEAHAVQRLSSVAHWEVAVETPSGPLHLLAFYATTPVFDGPEDLNGRRNHDEIMFWLRLLDGDLHYPPPGGPVVVIGDANLDADDGDGRHEAIHALLGDHRLQDPVPASEGGKATANTGHSGDPAMDTVDWTDPVPGNLRVDYVLPDARLNIVGSGVVWPAGGPFRETVEAASRHRLVWVDIAMP